MDAYKIWIHVEIAPCTEIPTSTPVKQEDDSVKMILAEYEASNIDVCE